MRFSAQTPLKKLLFVSYTPGNMVFQEWGRALFSFSLASLGGFLYTSLGPEHHLPPTSSMHPTPPSVQFWGSQAEIRHNLLGTSLASCWIQVSFHRAQSYQARKSRLNPICIVTHVGHQTVSPVPGNGGSSHSLPAPLTEEQETTDPSTPSLEVAPRLNKTN